MLAGNWQRNFAAPPALVSASAREVMAASLNHGDLPTQLAGKQALRDHPMDPAHDVDDLGDPEARRDAAQRVSVMRRQLGARRQKLDRVARGEGHRGVEILVET